MTTRGKGRRAGTRKILATVTSQTAKLKVPYTVTSQTAKLKLPVAMRALIARINRRLKRDADAGDDLKVLRAGRGTQAQNDLGRYYIVNFRLNIAEDTHVDPVTYGRQMGVLQPWEEVYDE